MLSWSTGTSAQGYMTFSGTQAPWSRPREACWWTGSVSESNAATLLASAPASGVRYSMEKYREAKPPKSYTSGVPAALAERLIGAASQCALTTRIAVGFGSACDQVNSSLIHRGSSNSGGAPWLRYSAGSGPSAGSQLRWVWLDGAADASECVERCPGNPGRHR